MSLVGRRSLTLALALTVGAPLALARSPAEAPPPDGSPALRRVSPTEVSPSELARVFDPGKAEAVPHAPWRPDPAVRARALEARRRAAVQGARVDAALMAGAARVVVTPESWEAYTDLNDDATYEPDVDTFEDTGTDGLWDWEEPGALGPDGQPGRAGFDDDFDGQTDEGDEHGSLPSDDVPDPSGDNYHRTDNPGGTEGNGEFDGLALAGFGGLLGTDIRPVTGVHDDLWARSLAVSQGGTDVIFIVHDSIGMLFHWMNPVKRAIEADLGVPFENIVIASTHTHQAPDTVGIWAGPLDYDYMARQMDGMYQAAVDAWASREEVSVRSTTVRPRACYDRETLLMKPIEDCVASDYVQDNLHADPSTDQYIVQNDLRDPWVRRMEIPVQQFVGVDGEAVATVVSFDTHPEVLLDENQLISSDYPNWTRRVLEDRFGGVALFFSSTVGCQMGALRGAPIPLWSEAGEALTQPDVLDAAGNPIPQWAQGAENRARSEGMEVGNAAADAIAGASPSASPQLTVRTEFVDVKISNPVYRLIISYVGRQSTFEEDEWVIDAPYCTHTGCVRTAISYVTIGDASYLTVPGEFPPEYVVGREASVAPYFEATGGEYEDWSFPAMPSLIEDVPTRDLIWIGLANNYFGYALPEADNVGFTNTEHPNYYEEVYDADPCFGDMVGNKLLDMLGSRKTFNPACRYHP